jgi:hypothetical protein
MLFASWQRAFDSPRLSIKLDALWTGIIIELGFM